MQAKETVKVSIIDIPPFGKEGGLKANTFTTSKALRPKSYF